MTTLYPRAVWREVTDESRDPSIIPVGCVLHVSGGEATSLFGYFDGPSGGIESHLHIARAPKPSGGGIEQYRDLDNEADANYLGNSWVGGDGRRYGFHSVETQGVAAGPWNPYQFEEVAQFLAWDSQRYGYPLMLCTNPKGPGVGWHVMWGAPGAWTPAVGKVCPGPDRIKQVPAVIERARQIVAEQDAPPSQEDEDMIGLVVTYQGIWLVKPDLSSRTGFSSMADLTAVINTDRSKYPTVTLSPGQMARIPVAGSSKVDLSDEDLAQAAQLNADALAAVLEPQP